MVDDVVVVQSWPEQQVIYVNVVVWCLPQVHVQAKDFVDLKLLKGMDVTLGQFTLDT